MLHSLKPTNRNGISQPHVDGIFGTKNADVPLRVVSLPQGRDPPRITVPPSGAALNCPATHGNGIESAWDRIGHDGRAIPLENVKLCWG